METTPSPSLAPEELLALVWRVFHPRPDDSGIAFLVDLPDSHVPDDPAWRDRRRLAREWADALASSELELPVHVFGYRNVGMHNADLPEEAWRLEGDTVEVEVEALEAGAAFELETVLRHHSIVLAPTTFSATAPLKLAAPEYGFRAATMPGFTRAMIDALRLDYAEVHRRVRRLKTLLDEASGAELLFVSGGREEKLHLDLRFRKAHASGGLVRERGKTGNLPSGEAFIVPYEGERDGEASQSHGTLPVELEGEVVFYDIRENRAVAVEGGGPAAEREAGLLEREPAYGNLAELGLGVLAAFGVQPIGELLLDEKLGLHIAFGRSDHFGGQVGVAQFHRPEAVVHIDRVYLPETQPHVEVRRVDLLFYGVRRPLMRNGDYVDG